MHPFVQFTPQPETKGAIQRGPSLRGNSEAQGCFLDESHGSRVIQKCLPLTNEFMLGDPCQLIVLIRLQWHQSELKKIVMRCPVSQRWFGIHELGLFESSVHCHAIQASLGCTDSSASHIEQRRWLAVAGPKTAEPEINLKDAINCVRFLKR